MSNPLEYRLGILDHKAYLEQEERCKQNILKWDIQQLKQGMDVYLSQNLDITFDKTQYIRQYHFAYSLLMNFLFETRRTAKDPEIKELARFLDIKSSLNIPLGYKMAVFYMFLREKENNPRNNERYTFITIYSRIQNTETTNIIEHINELIKRGILFTKPIKYKSELCKLMNKINQPISLNL